MTLYDHASSHARWMLGALTVAILFVAVIESFYGHSTFAFAAAIVGLVLANRRMLSFNCPHCGKNLFFRGLFVVPWPNRTCGKCGKALDR